MNKKQEEAYKKYMASGLYFVTCIRPKIFKYRSKETGEMKPALSYRGKFPTTVRCCGWYKKLKDAIKAVEENHMDIHEGDNLYAIIEKVPQGVIPLSKKVQWFIWAGDIVKGKYIKCEDPEWSKGICNWSL